MSDHQAAYPTTNVRAAGCLLQHLLCVDQTVPSNVSPHVGIYAIDIVQLPGFGISPIAGVARTVVPAALAAKAEARCEEGFLGTRA